MSAVEAAARKVIPRALDAFCFGCSLDVGVRFVTLLHLAIDTLVLVVIATDLIGKVSTFAVWYENDINFAIFLSGFTLCGVPICIAGFLGTFVKSETLVRVYWYYAVVCYIILLVFVVKDLVISGPCASIPVLLNGMAVAVTCGVFRIVNVLLVSGLVAVPLYFLFVVLSYCDNVAYGMAGPALHDLAQGSDRFYRPWLYKKTSDEVQEYAANTRTQANGYGNPARGGSYGSVYEQAVSQGLGGSRPIFGCSYHDMNYPRTPASV